MAEKPKSNPTMQDIAEVCGVSKMTVSLALRGHPRITLETRTKIREAAERLGYLPNPYVTTLMAQLRSGERAKGRPIIAFLNVHNPPAAFHRNNTYHFFMVGARQRAEELGFQLEEFQLYGEGVTIARLERIWRTRNIHLMLIGPAGSVPVNLDFHWERYATAKFAFSIPYPKVNLVASDHFKCVQLIVAQLLKRGYRNIGLAIPRYNDERVDHRWVGSFLSAKWYQGNGHRFSLFVPEKGLEQTRFIEWFERERPDAVISFEPAIPSWLKEAGYSVPGDVGFASIDWTRQNPHHSGVNQRPQRTGALAVDLVVEQLHRNERGIPQESKVVLVPGEWIEGETVKKEIGGVVERV